MPIAGLAAGAADALEQLVTQQLLRQRLEAEIADRERRSGLERDQLAQRKVEADADRDQRQQQIDLQAGDRRERQNVRGVRRMMGDAITQRTGPMTSDDRRGLAALQIEAGDEPTLLNEPAPKLRSVTVRGPNGQPINRMVPETEAVEEYREPRASVKPERDPIADYEERLKLDTKYKQPGASDPVAEAQDTAREARRLALALKDHQGLPGAFGVVDARFPTLRQATADAEVLRDALTSLLTLENMGKMKGVLSDSDMKVLRQASTTIAAPMSDAAARAELQRVADVMGRVTSAPTRGASSDVDAEIARIRAARRPPQ